MTRGILAAGLALALAACSTAPEDTPPPAPAPPPRPAPQAPPPPVVQDQCGAAQLQHLVGRPRSEIPIPVNPSRQRVACTTCPITMDYSAQRLNFFFDAKTGIIKEVRCG